MRHLRSWNYLFLSRSDFLKIKKSESRVNWSKQWWHKPVQRVKFNKAEGNGLTHISTQNLLFFIMTRKYKKYQISLNGAENFGTLKIKNSFFSNTNFLLNNIIEQKINIEPKRVEIRIFQTCFKVQYASNLVRGSNFYIVKKKWVSEK